MGLALKFPNSPELNQIIEQDNKGKIANRFRIKLREKRRSLRMGEFEKSS